MSRRYGRNQRRRAREELARMADELRIAKNLTAYHQRRGNLHEGRAALFEAQLKACAEALGESFALPPAEKIVGRDYMRQVESCGIRAYPLERSEYFQCIKPGQEPPAVSMLRTITLDCLEAHLETHGYGRLAEQPHMLLTCNGRTVYACPVPAFAQLNREEGIRRIANLIASEAIDTVRRLGHFR